jgi:hypothetical protein
MIVDLVVQLIRESAKNVFIDSFYYNNNLVISVKDDGKSFTENDYTENYHFLQNQWSCCLNEC